MKKSFWSFVLLLLLVTSAFAEEKKPVFCQTFDSSNEFVRCETIELTCYRFGKYENCWPKEKPAPAPKAPEVKKK